MFPKDTAPKEPFELFESHRQFGEKKKGQKTIADPYCGLGMAEAKVLSVLQKNTSKMLLSNRRLTCEVLQWLISLPLPSLWKCRQTMARSYLGDGG